MKKGKKPNKLIWQSCIFVSAVLAVFFLLISYMEYQKFQHSETEKNLNQTVLRAEIARQWVADRYEQFSILANVFSVADSAEQKIKLISEFKNVNYSIYKNLYYVDSAYNTLGENGKGSVSPGEFRKIFAQVGQSETSLLTKVEFLEDTKEPVFSVIASIRNEENILRGILVGVISLQNLQEHLNNAGFNIGKASEESSTWILDSEKQTILHSNQDIILDFRLDHGSDVGYKDISRLNELMDKNISGTIRYTIKDQENVYLSFVKTKISDGWVIMVGQLETSFWQFLAENLWLKLLFLVVSGALLCFWQIYIYQGLLRPFTKMKNDLVTFNSGNRYVVLETKPDEEAHEMAEQVRKLMETVVEQSYNVEKLIRDRTKALSDLNKTIATKNKELSDINAALTANNDHLHYRAMTDMLTKLLNRQELLKLTDDLILEAQKDTGKSFSILFLDLDNFKKYNDNFSHDIGDFVLKNISELIQNNVRAMDVSARYGGDEFVIIINHSEMAAAIATAERILIKIQEVNGYAAEIGELLGEEVKIEKADQISCSIGVVHYSSDLDVKNAEELMTLADDMMYQAKKAGKGRVEIYYPEENKTQESE